MVHLLNVISSDERGKWPKMDGSPGSKNENTVMSLLGEKTVRVAELEAENVSLRAQLEALRNHGAGAVVCPPPVGDDGDDEDNSATPFDEQQSTVTAEMYNTLVSKYNKLATRCNYLEGQHAMYEPRIQAAYRKFKEAKERARQWQVYCEKRLAKREPTKLSHHNEQTSSGDQAGQLDVDVTPKPNKVQHDSHSGRACEQAAGATIGSDALPSGSTGNTQEGRSYAQIIRMTSSQTTDADADAPDEHLSELDPRQPSSDDEPIVLSSRSVRRRRVAGSAMLPPVRVKQEPNSPKQPIEINSEETRSPLLCRQPLPRHQTSDLDVLAETLATPRKERRVRDVQLRAVSEEISRPPELITRVSSLSDSEMPLQQENDTAHRPEPEKPIRQERAADIGPSAVQHYATPRTLRPLSVNVPTNHQPQSARSTAKRKRIDEIAAAKVAMLSEDGENAPVNNNAPQAARPGTPVNVSRPRLDAMFDSPSPGMKPLTRSLTPGSGASRRFRKPLAPASKAQPNKISPPSDAQAVSESPSSRKNVKKASPREDQRRSSHQPTIQESPPSVKPEDEPLRLRPLDALRLEDFKINPKYSGAGFAFTDTVRGRDQRRCLPGCTKPECCGGAFLKAVEAGADLGSNKSDAEVLEAYLGPNWEQTIGSYSRDKRDDLLMQARAAWMANEHGKHRHAFERRSTPPGFWRTDMPTTQEEAEDRAKAHDLVRQKVEERWRDAMRGNGRWLFRDE